MTPDPAKGQPLYFPPEERVSRDETKHRVGSIQDLALAESKRVSNALLEDNLTRTVLVAAGAVLVVVSLAYFVGSRAGAARARASLFPE